MHKRGCTCLLIIMTKRSLDAPSFVTMAVLAGKRPRDPAARRERAAL